MFASDCFLPLEKKGKLCHYITTSEIPLSLGIQEGRRRLKSLITYTFITRRLHNSRLSELSEAILFSNSITYLLLLSEFSIQVKVEIELLYYSVLISQMLKMLPNIFEFRPLENLCQKNCDRKKMAVTCENTTYPKILFRDAL